MSNTTFWLNSPWYQEQAEMCKPAKMEKLTEFPFKEPYGGECPGVYYHRLQRDGWKMVRDEKGAGDDHIRVFEKVLPKGWVLEKSAHATIHHPVGKGCYFDTHRLLRPENGQVIDGHWGFGGRRSATTPVNSILAFLLIGLPCLLYTILGRSTLRPADPEADVTEDGFEDEFDDDDDDCSKGATDSDPPKSNLERK